jgi:hypothetical protein
MVDRNAADSTHGEEPPARKKTIRLARSVRQEGKAPG